jgi:predicted transcriptional regulator
LNPVAIAKSWIQTRRQARTWLPEFNLYLAGSIGSASRHRARRPKSLTELAELTGCQVLRMIKGYGLVTLKKNVREIEPVALAIEFKVMLG